MFIPLEFSDFEKRTGIHRKDFFTSLWDKAERIFALRDIAKVHAIHVMPMEYLIRLFSNIPIVSDEDAKPYKDCRIELLRIDPNGLLIGQTFLLRKKYQGILENFPKIFSGFCEIRGMAKLTARVVLGESAEGEPVIAHYVPPILEGHDSIHKLILLDGIHRNFLVKNVGTTLEAIVMYGVKIPFPARLMEWDKITVVDEKPPQEERFFELKPDLFRDLKSIGIDG